MADMTEEEVQMLVGHLRTMKVKPKVDTLDDFQAWMRGVSAEQDAKPSFVTYNTGAIQHFPKISPFSGDTKKEVAYDVWRSEVQCIIKEGHPPATIAQAIRSSLRGTALRVRSHLDPSASVDDILEKMDSVFGNVQQAEMQLAQFYSAKQQTDEDVATWSCRLEDLLAKAVESEQVPQHNTNSMLCTMFWCGLKPSLKDASGYLHESIRDFDQLRVAIRRLEEDWKTRQHGKKETAISKSAAPVSDTNKSELSELKGMINQLAADVKDMKMERQEFSSRQGNIRRQDRDNRRNRQQPKQYSGDGMNQSRSNSYEEPTCYRCGQKGHIKLGCRAKIEKSHPLNK